jgi:hypothetical protein
VSDEEPGRVADGSVWDEVLDTEHVIVVRTYIERWPRRSRAPEKVLVVVVEPDEEARNRCLKCGNRGVPVESDVRRWRTLDVHGKRCYLESAVPRIECAEHGKITASVPWARHDDRFTMPFEDHAAWLAAQMPWTKASAELRITWEALASIVARVAADATAGLDRLGDLRMIGRISSSPSSPAARPAADRASLEPRAAEIAHPARRPAPPLAKDWVQRAQNRRARSRSLLGAAPGPPIRAPLRVA